ncbi:MAG: LptF/LptG family permease [Pseudomonadota bacterium]
MTFVFTTLDRYIIIKVTQVFALVVLVLTCVVWLTQSLRLLEVLTENAIPVRLFLFLVLLSSPNFIYVILPIATAIAILIALHRLAFDHEMTAMIAVGASPIRLARPVFAFALIIAAITFYLGAFGTPYLNQKFLQLTNLIKTEHAAILLRDESFRRISDNVTFFIQDRHSPEDLRGILLYDGREADAPVTLVAESGRLEQIPGGVRLTLLNGNRQRGSGEDIDILRFGQYILTLHPQTDQSQSLELASEMILPDLWDASATDVDARGRLHHVFTLPLFTLICALMTLVIRARYLLPRFDSQVVLRTSLALALAQILYLAGIMTARAGHVPPIAIYLLLAAPLAFAYLDDMLGRTARPRANGPTPVRSVPPGTSGASPHSS